MFPGLRTPSVSAAPANILLDYHKILQESPIFITIKPDHLQVRHVTRDRVPKLLPSPLPAAGTPHTTSALHSLTLGALHRLLLSPRLSRLLFPATIFPPVHYTTPHTRPARLSLTSQPSAPRTHRHVFALGHPADIQDLPDIMAQ